MGLDITINKRQYRINSKKERECLNVEELCYFRKINFLVRFFEDLYNTEIENCVPFKITKKDIELLIDNCKSVLEHKDDAETLLPTTEGFFFGNTKYDKDYFESVDYILDSVQNYVLPVFDGMDPELDDITFDIWY